MPTTNTHNLTEQSIELGRAALLAQDEKEADWQIDQFIHREYREMLIKRRMEEENKAFFSEYKPFCYPTFKAKVGVIQRIHSLEIRSLARKLKNIRTSYADVREQIEFEIRREISCIEIETENYTRPCNIQVIIEAAKVRLINSKNNDITEHDFELIDLSPWDLKEYAIKKADEYQKNFTEWIFTHDYKVIQRDEPEEAPEEPKSLKYLTRRQRKVRASLELALKLVGKYSIKRATLRQLAERKRMNDQTKRFLDTHKVRSKTGVEIKLKDIALTLKKRMNEVYCMATGIQRQCEMQGMVWASIVITLPGRFHPNPQKESKITWDGTLPSESRRILGKKWENLRPYLAKYGITLTGLWTVEAHGDATPHINYLVYFRPSDTNFIRQAFEKYFGGSFNPSPRAVVFRLGGELKDGQKMASFASYALKYFTKSFANGENKDSKHNAAALGEEAWAASFNIRRYGLFGIPPLNGWRRVRACLAKPTDTGLEALWQAANSNNSSKYIRLNGGIGIKNKDRPFQNISVPVEGKSYNVVIGVVNTKTGAQLISKEIGAYEIIECEPDDEEDKWWVKPNTKKFSHLDQQLATVTLRHSYPSGVLNAHPETDFDSYYSPVLHRHPQISHPLLH